MSSPFPGMDPYLEDPAIWPDFHNSLADKIRDALNRDLPDPYYAQLESRSEVGLNEEPHHRVIVPDISVRRPKSPLISPAVGTAVAEPRAKLAESWEVIIEYDTTEVSFVEIRDSRQGHEVVTLIEIVSPSNKRPGLDRDRFLQKRSEILGSHTSLIEIDLLRTGDRSWTRPTVTHEIFMLDPSPDYLVAVNRAWQRGGPTLKVQVFPIALEAILPVIGVPLREQIPEVTLDLQFVFQTVYDTGPYRRGAVNYAQPPQPPLDGNRAAWAAQRVEEWQHLRIASPPAAE